jgi:hypothetical protein
VLSLVGFLIWSRGAFAANGPAFSTGPVNQPAGNFIREAISTLVVPEAPGPIVGNTVLWVGMGTSNGDLIQGINNNYPKDNGRNPCSNLGGNWCVAAYTLSKKRGSISGPRVTSKPGDKVTMHCNPIPHQDVNDTGLLEQTSLTTPLGSTTRRCQSMAS